MTLEDAFKYSREASGKASDVGRQLAFAGLALVWIFKTDQPTGTPHVAADFVLPTVLLVLGLAFDLLQYLAATFFWWLFAHGEERRETPRDAQITAPGYINVPAYSLLVLKITSIAVGYVLLLVALAHRLF